MVRPGIPTRSHADFKKQSIRRRGAMRKKFVFVSLFVFIVIGLISIVWKPVLWFFVVLGPLFSLGVYDMIQTRHAVVRNFPIVGWGRYIMEALRPKIYQYFVESDIDGRPISRVFRSVVYRRAKNVMDTTPYGTQFDVYRSGYEWMHHSLAALNHQQCEHDLRVIVGGPDCKEPYSASIFNISAMSYGALSKNAVLALNGGAKIGNFYHNTGEGGISSYHLEKGGHLVWQIGTGYFGCRTKDGDFSPDTFQERATIETVKMIEIKLSQGAKPGHGGILPAGKNTEEIAAIRDVEPHTDVLSPPSHTAFATPIGLVEFVQRLRELSGGKPVGFKLCVGKKSEFIALCKAMVETGIKPDFITVDGGEGGTGAAPLEYSNSVGMPLREGLVFVADCMVGFDLKNDIKVIASGKVFTGFHLMKNLAAGADMVNSARGMMLALGCIQARECNRNSCPTGITTQDPSLIRGLVVKDKEKRVASFHKGTVQSVVELLAAAGLDGEEGMKQLNRSCIYRRISPVEVRRYDEIYPNLEPGCLVGGSIPESMKGDFEEADVQRF